MDSPFIETPDLGGDTIGPTPKNWKSESESDADRTIQPGVQSGTASPRNGSSHRTPNAPSRRSGSTRLSTHATSSEKRADHERRNHGSVQSENRYLELGELGRGGWGVVGRVYDQQLQREVAVKRIAAGSKITALDHEQFLHEARVTSQLQHPGIVPVHELANDQNGETYYVMKLLEGDTLRHHIRLVHQNRPANGWNRHDLVVAITPLLLRFVDVCNAVSYAHQNGIIHRDLKPTNVMAGAFGETIVVDWGLAREISNPDLPNEDAEKTQVGVLQSAPIDPHIPDDQIDDAFRSSRPRSSAPPESEGSVIGTPSYMAPEQARGELHRMGIPSDVYALGGILYEIIAGQNAHAGHDVKTVLNRAQKGITTPLCESQSASPPSLAKIISTSMAFDPGERYPAVSQLADDIQRFVTGDRVSVYQETILEKTIRWCRRNRGTALTIAIAAVVLLTGSVFSSIVIRSAHRAEKKSRVEAELAHQRSLNRLIDARDSADTWLVELSGATQFHSSLAPIRQELISRATVQYERLLKEPIASLQRPNATAWGDQDLQRKWTTNTTEWLERAKCHIRLGDLHRLSRRNELAAEHYSNANQILGQIDAPLQNIRTVSLLSSPKHRVAGDWETHKPSLSDSIALEIVNAGIGELINGLSEFDAHRLMRLRERIDHWIPWAPPSVDLTNRQQTEATEFVCRVVSSRARLELAHSRSDRQLLRPNVDRLWNATRWARWLAVDRGAPKDLQLYEQLQSELATTYEDQEDWQTASNNWSELIAEIVTRDQSSGARSDWMQTLAFARMGRAELQIKLGKRDTAYDDYQAAIAEFETAWALTDEDAFFRTNLATAEINLAQLLDFDVQASREQAQTLISRSIQTYRQLLQESATPNILRRLADSHLLMVKLLDCYEDENATDEPQTQLLTHLNHARIAFSILKDQDQISSQDRAKLAKTIERLDESNQFPPGN